MPTPAVTPASPPAPAGPSATLAAVLAAVETHGGLPSTGHTLARLTRLLESDDEAVGELANLILGDMSLTQRLLRLANTIPFRTASGPVTTVTRAIALLGFDRVRAAVVSVVLLDGLIAPGQGPEVHAEFRQALLAGRLAREVLVTYDAGEAEEAAIAAMFRGVGRLLLAVFAPEALASIRATARAERVGESQAARRLLGCGLDELTAQVLTTWHVPERIVLATAALPARVEAPRAPGDRIRAVAHLADELAAVLRTLPHAGADAKAVESTRLALQPVLDRFAPAVLVAPARLAPMLEGAYAQLRDFEIALGLAPAPFVPVVPGGAPPDLDGQVVVPEEVPSAQRDAAGRPANSQALLLAGLAEATDLLTRPVRGGTRPSGDAVVRVVLETIYRSLGFDRAALLMRDPARGVIATRITVGRPPLHLQLPLADGPDLLRTAMARATDIYLGDLSVERLRQRLPEALLREAPGVRSLLVMPLAAGTRVLGALVADRTVTDPAGLATAELHLLRTLRAHVLLALQ